MRKRIWLAVLLLASSLALAAGQSSPIRCSGAGLIPTATFIVQCTPPPCDRDAGEVYHCPEECPGGCGTECATVTPAPPSPTPTATHLVQCTPPPCDRDAGEVYYCPDECPGGCGTECATVTPAPSSP
jgi:hypothetical protein